MINHYSRCELRHALKRADLTIFDEVLCFLEDDPRTCGSGYIKEDIWRSIRHYPLNEAHIARLENAALSYLYRPMSREFGDMCRAMTWIATPEFWSRVAEELSSEVSIVQLNTWCLHGYAGGLMAGEQRRRDCDDFTHHDMWKWRYNSQRFYTPEKLTRLLHEPEYWPHGKILQRSEIGYVLSIVYYMINGWKAGVINEGFARLNIRAANIDLLLPKLEEVLIDCSHSRDTETSWLQIIYLMRQIDDVRVVPILIKFLETHVNYKFESMTKSLLLNSTLNVLRYYATPEALAVVQTHNKAD